MFPSLLLILPLILTQRKCCILFRHKLLLQKTLIVFLSGLHSCFGILISTKLNLSRSIMQPPQASLFCSVLTCYNFVSDVTVLLNCRFQRNYNSHRMNSLTFALFVAAITVTKLKVTCLSIFYFIGPYVNSYTPKIFIL